jgi:hypothetical protein
LDALEDAAFWEARASTAEASALVACVVTSLIVESWVESPVPPVPRYIAIISYHY